MALLHRADIRPSKVDLLTAWVPTRPWYQGPASPELAVVAAFRLDDPANEVGIETILVGAGDGPLLQVPLTYRGAPLDGHEQWLVGTTDHSVLGPRWVYDACGDPVYAAVLADTIFTGGTQAEQFFEVDGQREVRESSTLVKGSGAPGAGSRAAGAIERVDDGDPALIVTDSVELAVKRILDDPSASWAGADAQHSLAGTWSGQPSALILAYARAR